MTDDADGCRTIDRNHEVFIENSIIKVLFQSSLDTAAWLQTFGGFDEAGHKLEPQIRLQLLEGSKGWWCIAWPVREPHLLRLPTAAVSLNHLQQALILAGDARGNGVRFCSLQTLALLGTTWRCSDISACLGLFTMHFYGCKVKKKGSK